MLRCADNSLYTGICKHLQQRLHEHNHDNKKAAKYTRVRRPLELVYYENCASRSDASSREYEIKHFSKNQKEALLAAVNKKIKKSPLDEGGDN